MFERPKITTYKKGDVRKYAHLKRDGIMVTVKLSWIQDECHMQCLTRHPDGAHDIAKKLVLSEAESMHPLRELASRAFKGALFCELYAPGYPASQVKSFLADEKISSLRIECFAIPSQSANISLEALRDYCSLIKFPFTPFERVQDSTHEMIGQWQDSEPDDTEGLVLKDGNLLRWCKWKPVLTTDLVVLGFKEGRGKYLGTLGALELGLADGTHVCNCSGMDDETRDLISENEDEWLGKVIEVEYQRLDSGGGLRHPRFKCRRDDKEASECLEI